MSANVRDYIKAELAPLMPSDWVWIPAQRMPETLRRTTVVLKHTRIEHLEEAPIGWVRHEVTLSIFTPLTDPYPAENDLDDAVTELVTAIDGHPHISWADARKVISPNDTNLGWDISLSIPTLKE